MYLRSSIILSSSNNKSESITEILSISKLSKLYNWLTFTGIINCFDA